MPSPRPLAPQLLVSRTVQHRDGAACRGALSIDAGPPASLMQNALGCSKAFKDLLKAFKWFSNGNIHEQKQSKPINEQVETKYRNNTETILVK